MAQVRVELAEIVLPDFGEPTVEPHIGVEEYQSRIDALWQRAAERGLDLLLVYGDREHAGNLAFLTGFDPRFEEALLILNGSQRPLLLVGNECWNYCRTSPLPLERCLYQPFSLMGQDRSRSASLLDLLRQAGLRPGSRVGIVDWKYYGAEAGSRPELWINAPAYLVDTVREYAGCATVNATDILMNPRDGLRALNSVDQLACLEFAATCLGNVMRRILWSLRPGLSEYEAVEAGRLNGYPLCVHPMVAAGPRAALGMASPSLRRMQRGEPVTCALGFWGALNARAGFLVAGPKDLPADVQDYVQRLVEPYYAAIVAWYEHIGLGVRGGELDALIKEHLDDPFFGVSLNPGHLIHLDEWMHTPIYPGSDVALRSGLALQVDVIPATGGPYFTSNVEDGIALADETLRRDLAARWPETWARIQARRAFMQGTLGIRLKPEVLPFSNIPAYLPPYLLAPQKAMRVAGR